MNLWTPEQDKDDLPERVWLDLARKDPDLAFDMQSLWFALKNAVKDAGYFPVRNDGQPLKILSLGCGLSEETDIITSFFLLITSF